MSENPFQVLAKKNRIDKSDSIEFDDQCTLNNLIEEIFLMTIKNDLSTVNRGRPQYLYYLKDFAESGKIKLNLEDVDNLIFERIFNNISKDNILSFEDGYPVEYKWATDTNPISYLFTCFVRISNKKNNTVDEVTTLQHLKKSIINQAAQYVINSRELSPTESGINIYEAIKEYCYESELLGFFSDLFTNIHEKLKLINESEDILIYFIEFFRHFLKQTFLNKMPPNSNALGMWKDPLQTLYCPERKLFVNIMSVLVHIPIAAELILDFSTIGVQKGVDFERCLLGRFLCATHLPVGVMQTPEFFTNMPMTLQAKNLEEQNIWQMSKACMVDANELFMTIFRGAKHRPNIKVKILSWFGKCLTLNSDRNKLSHSLTTLPTGQDSQLAGDGFFMNLANVIYHIANPLLAMPLEKVLTVQLPFLGDKDHQQNLLPKLHEETRLSVAEEAVAAPTVGNSYTVLSQLFFLAHKSMQLSQQVAQAKFMELNQQLHRVQEMYEELLSGANANSGSPEVEQMRRAMSGQMSLYMSLSAGMRQPELMQATAGLVIGSCKMLVNLAKDDSSQLQFVPEMVMDNIVGFMTFLRHFDDGFLETSGFPLTPLLEMSVLYMGSTIRVKNPHLRSKIPSLLECLIPQREEAPTAGNIAPTFYMREAMFRPGASWTHDLVIEALFSAFTTMELSTGAESVRFEEKFEYRRPMYACLRYFYGKPKFDEQVKKLAQDTLDNINDVEAPLCLKFLNLLINDATFLLDEALNYLGQLKAKEIERLDQGGKYSNQTDEANFQHMAMLAKYHNTLASDTIEQLGRMARLCPGILVHPVLVDRTACTLNFFLDHLVGPKRSSLTVRDKEAYSFRPRQLVQMIAGVYVSLCDRAEFCVAVVNDGRSYSDRRLTDAADLLTRVAAADCELVQAFQQLVHKLRGISAEQNEEDENVEDAPEEFCDPIMGTVMKDPVTLPSSGVVVDKKTIFRHLLSDTTDPFNRQPLSMVDVLPNTELKTRVLAWIEEKKARRS